MKLIDIGIKGVGELIAQSDTNIVLSDWFESNDDRSYVVYFQNYCSYISLYGRDKFDSAPFNKAYKLLMLLEKGQSTTLDDIEVSKIITDAFCVMQMDVGMLLLKSSALLGRGDSDYRQFNILMSLPKSVIDRLGELYFDDIEKCKGEKYFYKIREMSKFEDWVAKDYFLQMICEREDFCLQDVLKLINTPYFEIAQKGLYYIMLGKDGIKARMAGELYG